MRRYIYFVFAILLLASCSTKKENKNGKTGSAGKTLELLVSMDNAYYTGENKALIDSIFGAIQEGLPQPQPRFDIVNVPLSSLLSTKMFQMHRNILVFDIKEDNDNKVYINHDQWATPQVVAVVVASSDESARSLLRKHYPSIMKQYYIAEHKRVDNAFYATRNIALMERIKKDFGFTIMLPDDFRIANHNDGWLWVRKETKDFGLNIFIHKEPYRREEQLNKAVILDRIDTLMRRNIPGPIEGSYLGTERRVEIEQHLCDFEGSKYCVESRGLWRTFGDYNGGSFVEYTLLDNTGANVIDLLAFVYCPRHDRYNKRDLLMQLEGICYSLKWEGNGK